MEHVADEDPEEGQALTRIAAHDDLHEPLWCDEETGDVYNAKKEHVGTIEDGRLRLVKKAVKHDDCVEDDDESA